MKTCFRPRAAACCGSAFLMLIGAAPAGATDLSYVLMSPSFGGTNPAAMQMAQYDRGLRLARDAAAAAAARTTTPSDPNQAFVNAIISQLNGLVAQSIAQKIANSQAGQAGVIQSGATTITYMNTDGQLSVTIVTPSGTTTLTVPAGA